MLEEIAKERKLRESLNPSLSWSHELGDRQWEYYKSLVKDAKLQFPPSFSVTLLNRVYDKTKERRSQNARAYKNDMIFISEGEPKSFRYVESPDPTN